MAAVLAKRHSIPFYVACPLSTIDLATPNGTAIPIEERNADEVTSFHGHQWAPKKANIYNPVFDIMPADLVTALITEKGVVEQPNLDRITRLFRHKTIYILQHWSRLMPLNFINMLTHNLV